MFQAPTGRHFSGNPYSFLVTLGSVSVMTRNSSMIAAVVVVLVVLVITVFMLNSSEGMALIRAADGAVSGRSFSIDDLANPYSASGLSCGSICNPA